MLGVLQAAFQRVRHSCWQTGARLCNRDDTDNSCCGCCCGGGRSSANGGGGGSSNGGANSCGSRRAGLCCSWVASLLFGWDWLPLPTSGGSAAAGGSGGTAPESHRHGSGSLGVSSRGSGGVGGGGAADVAVPVALGDAGGAGMRRLASSLSSGSGGGGGGEDVKPLLARTVSAEYRDKEKRFIKGRFVMPGSDVQRRIADAMAGMLKAGGRAMTGKDTTSGGAIGGAVDHPNRHSASGDEYRVVDGQASPTRRREGLGEAAAGHGHGGGGGQFRPSSSSTSLSSPPPSSSSLDVPDGGGGGSGGTSTPSRRAVSARRGAAGERQGFGGGPAQQEVEEEARECVICMEEFSKADPEMLTLCSCGVNKTFFHYSCLLQWLSKHSYCPACRGYLFFEERRPGGDRSLDPSGNSAGGSSGSTRMGAARPLSSATATAAALRAGLGSSSSPRGAGPSGPP